MRIFGAWRSLIPDSGLPFFCEYSLLGPTIIGLCVEHQNTRIKVHITYIDSNIIYQSTMPSNRTFDDIDFVPPTRKAKEPPPPPGSRGCCPPSSLYISRILTTMAP